MDDKERLILFGRNDDSYPFTNQTEDYSQPPFENTPPVPDRPQPTISLSQDARYDETFGEPESSDSADAPVDASADAPASQAQPEEDKFPIARDIRRFQEEHPESRGLPPSAQKTSGIKYDDFMYEPIGFSYKQPSASNLQFNSSDISGSETDLTLEYKNSRFIFWGLISLFAVIIIMAAVCIVIDVNRSPQAFSNYKPRQNVVLYQAPKPVDDADDIFKDDNGRYTSEGVAAYVRPSIVEIYTYSDRDRRTLLGTGSGIIINEDGYIITNAHVLNAEGYHDVVTSDDKTYRAEVIGRDAKTDIAVIKIDAAGLTPATLGDSDEVLVGEQVMAIGNPAGLSGTVTNGIVSAVNRKIKGDSSGFEMNCIQTNTAISPGNSGGALVNMYCQVIGITSSKYVSDSYEGLGFAITINDAKPIIEALIESGYIPGRFRVGIILLGTDTPEARAYIEEEELGFKLPEKFYGIYIKDIADGSSIGETELEIGDFITKIGDNSVSNYDELYAALCLYEIGEKIPADCAHVSEDGEITTYKIEFKTMPDTSGNY